MPRSLRLWNGRWGRDNEQHIYIAAYSQGDAVKVIEELFGDWPRLTLYELQNTSLRIGAIRWMELSPSVERGLQIHGGMHRNGLRRLTSNEAQMFEMRERNQRSAVS